MKVLIADDSVMVCRRLASLLVRHVGITIVGEAHTVPEAISAIDRYKPEVIILDIQMPGGTGMDVLQKAKQILPTCVVIMFTNYNYPQYRKRYLEAGADFFFDKSTDYQKLTAILDRMSETVLATT